MTRPILLLATIVFVSTARHGLAQQRDSASAAPPQGDCTAGSPAANRAAMDDAAMDHGTMDHAAHLAAMKGCAGQSVPTSPGQAAFGAIAEVVRILEADPATDWTKVNMEALRQHLIDMDDVTLHSSAAQHDIAGGIVVDVTGSGRTIAAIRRMTINHSSMLTAGDEYDASAVEIPHGARFTVTAKNAADSTVVARIRGLGFAGIMTEGDHHARHHLALARGESVHSR